MVQVNPSLSHVSRATGTHCRPKKRRAQQQGRPHQTQHMSENTGTLLLKRKRRLRQPGRPHHDYDLSENPSNGWKKDTDWKPDYGMPNTRIWTLIFGWQRGLIPISLNVKYMASSILQSFVYIRKLCICRKRPLRFSCLWNHAFVICYMERARVEHESLHIIVGLYKNMSMPWVL